MRNFDYSFLRSAKLPAQLLNMTSGISSLQTMTGIRKTDYAKVYTELEAIAKLQSVKGSNAIEGIATTDARLRAIVNQNSAPLNHNEAEIAGYRDALNQIHTGYAGIEYRESTVLSLHQILLRYTTERSGGRYKTEDNVILAVDSSGQRSVRFHPTPAAETPAAMEQLFLAYADVKADAGIHPLLLIPFVILDFLCIHPFDDGNGRISRLLSLLLLYKAGFDVGKYVSFEEQINLHKGAYYEALRQSSEGWGEGKNDYIPFMEYFLFTLLKCYQELDKRFSIVEDKRATKKARIEATVLNSLAPISKAELCAMHPDISPTTVEAALGAMVKNGRIRRIGAARASRYIKAD
ncbi:MAG: Fic family protein [Clostridiales bacterium]|nr:Fic family protein [Clostridiales bacterium]